MKLDSDRMYAALIESGEDWADKDAAASILEETKRSVMARLKNNAGKSSDAANETVALGSEEYEAHITGMVEARRVANRAKVKYESAKVLAEFRRSEESTRRAEMTLR